MPDRKKAANGCLSNMDRLSDLPDSILHLIISFLGTKQACLTTVLSKRWVNIWSTGFILDFNPYLFKNVPDRYVSFIETTMQRYSKRNLSIRKLTLQYENFNKDMEPERIDRWLGIALDNQVEDLSLDISEPLMISNDLPSYGLPMILFSAKSLINLKCWTVRVPCCPSVMLISLQSLDLSYVDIDEHMLHHLISSCPLKKLWLNNCTGIANLVIPNRSKIELLDVGTTIPQDGSIKVETSSIKYLSFWGINEFNPRWPFNFSLASKKNLSVLRISSVDIMCNVIEKLVAELSSIKIMSLENCTMTHEIRIGSLTIEDLEVKNCYDLVIITLDTPQLKTFCYTGDDLKLLSLTSSQCICNARLNMRHYVLDNQSLVKLNRLLRKSKCFNVLSIDLRNVQFIIDRDEVSRIDAAAPYEVEELELLLLPRSISEKSTLIALLDGLFWCWRPSVLSLSFILEFDERNNTIIKFFLETLRKMVRCRKRPLKRIETKSRDYSTGDIQLRLFW